jgi:YegS/Rv2252/BmrU family lipid kinase
VEVDDVHGKTADRNSFLFFDTNSGHMPNRPDEGHRVVILNPKSGSEDHTDAVRELAADHGFEVRETVGEGDAPKLAAEAATGGADFVAAAGGDGTINEVLNGLHGAEALEEVTVGVVPAGTGNNFASNVGIRSIEHAFEVFEDGDRRAIDLGVAAGRAFINSCVGGITADASAATTPEAKRNFGVMAYVMSTVKEAVSFEGLSLAIETNDAHSRTWSGEAAFVLVGNGRRFPVDANTQANMEDGLFAVTVVEDGPTVDVVGEAAIERLFGESGDHIYRLSTPGLTVRSIDDEPVSFSLDGEMITSHEADIETLPGRVTLPVGDGYDPDPDTEAPD